MLHNLSPTEISQLLYEVGIIIIISTVEQSRKLGCEWFCKLNKVAQSLNCRARTKTGLGCLSVSAG